MKQFCIVILFILSVSTTSALAQGNKVPNLWAGIQANVIPAFQVNSIEHTGTQSQGIIISISDFEQSRFGVNFQLFRGFHSAVDFLYGAGIFYAVINNDIFRLKSGINISRFAVNDYRRESDVVGGKIEDQFPDTFKPYLEIEWPLAKSISLTLQGGYRLVRSDITTIEEILERYPDGSPYRVHATDNQKWYGSGFEFGFGIQFKIY
ncbi:hypothetical protein [Fodinibius sp.]|uniref:hypothetical protein n=1 Tax=Fodinibius sp. TaxID=1872440 RepID=UPI002ACD3B67|nr:hypothetical protein [Fodinibius sp.]MDZ7658491.1 hypothetical protein [Fodinibius sp.]